MTEKIPPQYFKRDSFDISVARDIDDRIKTSYSDEEFYDQVEDAIIPKYGWEYVQQALFSFLLDDSASASVYEEAADVIWSAVLNGRKLKNDDWIAVLPFR